MPMNRQGSQHGHKKAGEFRSNVDCIAGQKSAGRTCDPSLASDSQEQGCPTRYLNPKINVNSECRKMIHVLLIEDNPGDVLMIREALRTLQLAAETTVVYDGQQALALLNSGFRPDLVVLDLNIPRCDGLEVLKRWKTGIRPPVIVFSNSGDNVITDREAELGVREHIGKPSDVGKYMTVIGGALGRWMAPR